MPRPDHDLSAVLRSLATLPVDRHFVSSVLEVLVDRAAPLQGTAPAASLTFVRSGAGRTVASTADVALHLDEVQYRADAGPCVDAATRGRPARALTDDGAHWPDIARALRDAGIGGIRSHPLPLSGPVTGSLNLYVPDAAAGQREATAALVEVAAVPGDRRVALRGIRAHRGLPPGRPGDPGGDEQAKGILMERLKITADKAFDALARTSNDTNTKLRGVAQAVVNTGQLPR